MSETFMRGLCFGLGLAASGIVLIAAFALVDEGLRRWRIRGACREHDQLRRMRGFYEKHDRLRRE